MASPFFATAKTGHAMPGFMGVTGHAMPGFM
jgi:hypothetical protein